MMIELTKIASRHDSDFKLTPSTSNETSIYLPRIIADYISNDSSFVTFKIFREDFLKAIAIMCRIPEIYFKKEQDPISSRMLTSYLYPQIEAQFGSDESKYYPVYHFKRDDGRCYLNNLLQPNGFNIRNFLVEKYVTVQLGHLSEK